MEQVVDFEGDLSAENSDLFDCEYDSIDSVINKVIVFTGVKQDAFFTDSKRLKDVVCNPTRHFPFRAIIKVMKFGANTGFKFFPPNSQITQEDNDNFDYYRRNKNRRHR